MNPIRIGVIGLGNMGAFHAQYLHDGIIAGATLAALCDSDPEKLARQTAKLPAPGFASYLDLLASGLCDAILIAVPHYDHIPIAAAAFARGTHVLVEKPLAVSVTAARAGIHAYETALQTHPHLKFGIMFNQRTNPLYQKIRALVQSGELGVISRITWLVTNWFRTWAYYASGGWRATWLGEGGGVLINQCPHNLDLIQWVLNGLMPTRVTAVGFIGKTHPIEVEDEISAILEYPHEKGAGGGEGGGAIGHFITSTGEAPGTNRLEICGSRGKIVAEDGKLTFLQSRTDIQEFNRTSPDGFRPPEMSPIELPLPPAPASEHQAITRDFIAVIRENKPNNQLLAPGPQGLHGLELGNAIMMAALTRTPVTLPVDGAAFDRFIADMAKKYGGKKTLATTKTEAADFTTSFSH